MKSLTPKFWLIAVVLMLVILSACSKEPTIDPNMLMQIIQLIMQLLQQGNLTQEQAQQALAGMMGGGEAGAAGGAGGAGNAGGAGGAGNAGGAGGAAEAAAGAMMSPLSMPLSMWWIVIPTISGRPSSSLNRSQLPPREYGERPV